jgi:hypothetical protein
MGAGEYRRHFFGEMTWWDLLRFGVQEKVRYAPLMLRWRQRQAFKQKVK